MKKSILFSCYKTFLLASFILAFSASAQDVNVTDKFINGVYGANLKDVQEAVQEGADVNMMMYGQVTALQAAASRGDLAMVKFLISKQADVNLTKRGGWTALMGAADNGHLDVVKELVKHKADVNGATAQGRTVLMRAAYHGQKGVLQFLLSKGAKVNATDSQGVTALMLAAQQGFADSVKILLAAKADKNLKNTLNQKTALAYAQERNSTSYVSGSKVDFEQTIKLLSDKLASAGGKLVGKVHAVKGTSVTITGKDLAAVKPGNKLRVKTADGDVVIVAKQGMHTQLKAIGTKAQTAKIKKGNQVFLVK